MDTVRRKVSVILVLFLAALVAFSPMARAAGSLEPNAPPGPVMKSLDEVEPRIPIPGSSVSTGTFVISQSGSYYLTGDRLASGVGISVDVNDVTIDLMGFSLIGSGTAAIGITLYGRSNVEIRNGTIRNFGYHGILEYNWGSGAKNHRIINVRLINNGRVGSGYYGINMQGNGHLIKDCTVKGNSGFGFDVGTGCLVTGNIVCFNGETGFRVGFGSTVVGNTAYNNTGVGIVLGNYCMADQNTSYNNGGTNLQSGTGCVLGTNCAPESN
jgi:hypothetical protein